MYRLKSCVDFKPYEGESTYISFTKLDGLVKFTLSNMSGIVISIMSHFQNDIFLCFCHDYRCWSFVGDLKTGQNVSIGDKCDTKAIVEHELLHALGFYHEQSRSDRDDYVQIWWDQIIPGFFASIISLFIFFLLMRICALHCKMIEEGWK